MQHRFHQTKIHDVDELKQQLIDVWHGFNQIVIYDASWSVAL